MVQPKNYYVEVLLYKTLHYDVLALTETHNLQHKIPDSKLWITSTAAGVHKVGPKKGKCVDPAAGVTIMFSPRMLPNRGSGHVGTRIAWVRFAGPVCNISPSQSVCHTNTAPLQLPKKQLLN